MQNLILDNFIECFWLTATEAVKLFVPIVAIVILFKILHYFLLGGR